MYGFDGHQQQGDFGTFIVQSAATTSYGRGSGGRGHRGGGAGGNFQPAEFSGAYRGGSGASPNPSAYANNAGGWNPQNQHQSPPRNLLGGAGMTVTAGNANSALPNAGGGDDVYEVHDNQLKAPVSIRHQDVLPTHGSHRLFSAPPQQLNAPGQTPGPSQQRNPARICESYQHGQCLHGEECPDVHVVVDVLHNMRQQMVAWLMSKEEEFNGTAARAPETTFRVFAADLKEVVDVPIGALSFTRGLYVDPSARAKRSRYGQQSAFALMAAQVPTACGLHSVDPTQCKWGRWCNQAHIDPMWMRMKRGEFENWSRTLEQQYEDMPDDHVFVVHDPQIKTALQIPKIAIAGFSRGLFQGNAKKAPSVCMLYQRGRCTAGSCCNQIHIFADYIVLLRQYLADGNPELLFAMQQVAMQQKQLLQMQQQQQQQQQIASTLGQLNSGHLNPGARPFVPPGAANAPVAFDNAAAGAGNGYSAQQPLQGVRLPAQSSAHPFTKADTPGGAVSPKLGDSESMLPPPMVNFAPLAAMSNDDPAGRGGSLHSSPHLGPGSPHSAMRQVLSHSPYRGATAVSGLLADLRADDDEVYVERGRRPSANPMSASQSSPMTPMKRNNPYQQAQKPIGVPPSPLHGIALPASAVAPMSQHQTAAQQHMERSIPHTPPMSFGWVPQARMPPSMGGLPPPPSPYRSSFLKNNTPTSPHHNPTTYTPDLSHMYFSPSPLLRSADSMSYMPKNMSLDAFEDFHLQQSLHSTTTAPPNTYAHQASHSNTSGGGGHAPVSTSGGSSYAGPPFSPGSGSLAPPAAASNNQYTAVGSVRQSQPYQQTSMPNSSSQSSSTPSRVGNGTPVDQSGGAARTT